MAVNPNDEYHAPYGVCKKCNMPNIRPEDEKAEHCMACQANIDAGLPIKKGG